MDATTDLRSREDAAFEPQGTGWMHRSEAFAEDVDHLLPEALPVTGRPNTATTVARLTESHRWVRWPAIFSASLFSRPHSAD